MKKTAVLSVFCASLFLFGFGEMPSGHPTVTTIAVGVNPAGVVVTSDNRFVYVANNNSVTPGTMNGSSISVLDANSNTVIKTISDPSFNGTYALALSADGSTVFALNSGVSLKSSAKTITLIDTHTNNVTGTISGFNGPDAMALTPDGKFAYVANYGYYDYLTKDITGNANTISLVDLTTKTIAKTITVGVGPDSLAVAGDNLYVANFYDNTISVVNLKTHVVSMISDPKQLINGPYDIAADPNGLYAYVTNFGNPIKAGGALNNSIAVINLKDNTVEKNVVVGPVAAVASSPAGVAVSGDGKHVYVTNYMNNGTVTVLDANTHKVVRSIPVGNLPGAITISPDSAKAYVTNYSDNTVSVITLKEITSEPNTQARQ